MKKIFLFSTRLRVYWVLLPIAALFTACVFYNQYSKTLFKFYPLMALLIGATVFIIVYFFQGIRLGYDEIRSIGLFSSRDSAVITEGKNLILREIKHGKLELVLFGNDGVLPELDWMKSSGDAPRDISLFRGITYGGKRSFSRIAKFFGLSDGELSKLYSGEGFTFDGDIARFSACTDADGKLTLEILITKTV